MSTELAERIALGDPFGRVARDLRVSLTDRCNLRCRYCLPESGATWLPRAALLTDAEVIRLIRVAVNHLGVAEVRFTGGEPLLRPGLTEIIAATVALRTDLGASPEVSVTTNGVGLAKRVPALLAAGLSRVNVSLDSINPERYAAIARRDRLGEVLSGLAAAAAAGLAPVKVNTVVLRGVNEVDIVPLADFCLRHGYRLRFIEQMPLGPESGWQRTSMVTAAEILALLRGHLELSPASDRGSAPAAEWLVVGNGCHPAGRIGVIPSVTQPFCGACDRTRLTADGQLRTCLFANSETDLRTPLREGAADQELARVWCSAHLQKAAGHSIARPEFSRPQRTMSAIGG